MVQKPYKSPFSLLILNIYILNYSKHVLLQTFAQTQCFRQTHKNIFLGSHTIVGRPQVFYNYFERIIIIILCIQLHFEHLFIGKLSLLGEQKEEKYN